MSRRDGVKSPGKYKVPFDAEGNLLHYPGFGDPAVDWRENVIFEADLVLLDDIGSGRSAKYVWWKDNATGLRYPMFVVDLVDLARHSTIEWGEAGDYFVVRKRGQNYGLMLWRHA